MEQINWKSSKCNYCKQGTIIEDPRTGFYACNKCGREIAQFINDEPVHREFEQNHGTKTYSQSSYAGDENVEDLGTSIALSDSSKSKRYKKINAQITNDPKVTKIKKHVQHITAICNYFRVEKSICQRCCRIWQEAFTKGLTDHKNQNAIDAACFYYGCNEKGLSYNKSEILASGTCPDVSDKVLQDALDIIKDLPSLASTVVTFENMVPDFSATLDLPEIVSNAAFQICKFVREKGICEGKKPATIVAASIAYAANHSPVKSHRRSLNEISQAIGPKETTIKQALNSIEVVTTNIKQISEFKILMTCVA